MRPKSKEVWLVFDLSNGDPASRRYVWWFDSLSAARRFKRDHNKRQYASVLSKPFRYKAT